MWSREDKLSPRDRSFLTVTAFEQLKYHMTNAKENGITKEEISEMITQLAFYVGWPKAWSAFGIAKEIWK